jgi:hypothetical protein
MDTTKSGKSQVAGPCECGYEPSSFIKGKKSIDKLSNFELIKKVSTARCETVTFYTNQYLNKNDVAKF